MDGCRKPSALVETSVELIKQVEDLIQKLDSDLTKIVGIPWVISSLHKEHWIAIDKFVQTGFEVCVASLLMSHQIVEYLSVFLAAVGNKPRGTSALGAIGGMISTAMTFHDALLELCGDYVKAEDLSDRDIPPGDPLQVAEYYRASIGLSHPLQNATSLIDAARSLDEGWQLALLAGNSGILDSAREELVKLFREHAIRVQVLARELWKYCRGAVCSPSRLDDLFTRNLWNGEEEYSPDAQYAFGLLENYLNNSSWNFYQLLDYLFCADAIYGFNHIQSSSLTVLIHDTLCKINTVASTYLRFLEQIRIAFSSALAIEKGLRCIQTAGCYQLLQDPALTLSFMIKEKEITRNATEEARATVYSLLSLLEELQQCPGIKCQGDNSDTIQDDIPCIKCIINTLHLHCESILRDVLGGKQLSWAAFEPPRTVMVDSFPVVEKLIKEPRKGKIDFCERLLDEFFAPVTMTEPSVSESPAPNASSDIQDQVTVWSYLVLKARKPISRGLISGSSSRKVWQWKPCKAKEQAKFARDSRESRMRFKREKNGTGRRRCYFASHPFCAGWGTKPQGNRRRPARLVFLILV